ncbi:MAG: DUF885 domain-containing protein [Eubacterium sp.]|nr:DUF885 domain-containing protein [Eubacterium sp.]
MHSSIWDRKYNRIIAAVLVLSMLFSLTGCGSTAGYIYGKGLRQLDLMEKANEIPSLSGNGNGSDDSSNSWTFDPDDNAEYAETENQEFEDYLSDCFKKAVTQDSISYNYQVKDGSKFGIEPPKATLGDARLDQNTLEKQKKEMEEDYQKLLSFENAELTEEERFIYETMKTDSEIQLHLFDNTYLYEPFSPMRGVQANIATNFTDYRFDDKSDVEDYVIMMGQMRDYFDTMLEFEYEKSKAGYFMADKIADKIIEQCDEFTAEKSNHFLIESFDSRIDQLSFLTAEEKKEYKERDKQAVLNSAIPAFEDLKKTMQELKGTGQNELGLCYYDGGREYYTGYVFPVYSGSSKTVSEEINVTENRQQNLILQMTAVYYSNPDAYQYFTANYKTLQESYDKKSASELLDYFMENVMDEYPDLERIPYNVNYLDKHMEKIMDGVLAYYMSPPIDDEDNNLIYVNGAHPDGMWTTLSHEGCPGHMFQNAYFQSTDPKPIRAIQGNLGYMEGWAVYTSYNSLNHCDFDGSEYAPALAQLYKLNEDLGYLLYGRIDMGVNFEGWNLDDVKSFLERSGYSTDIAEDVMTIVIGDPGVYLSYTVGYYEMEEMREYAEQELGSNFDAKEYHKAILSCGPCQYKDLKIVVDKYIEENR